MFISDKERSGGLPCPEVVDVSLIISKVLKDSIPIGSMYGIFAYMFHKNHPNVGKYTIHGSYGILFLEILVSF